MHGGFVSPPPAAGTISRIDLRNAGNALYLASIKVGWRRVPFQVVVDTGSSGLWLPGRDCACGGRHQRYSGEKSRSSRTLSQSFTASYVSGSVSGSMYRDDIWLGQLRLELDFGVVSNACNLKGYQEAPYDGVLGLGAGLSNVGSSAVLKALQDNAGVEYFAVHLGRQQGPQLLFQRFIPQREGVLHQQELRLQQQEGGDPHSRANLQFLQAESAGWYVQMQAWLGTQRLMKDPVRALVDTGSTLTIVPLPTLRQLAKKLGAEPRSDRPDLYDIPCSLRDAGLLPVVKLNFSSGNETWALKLLPQDYILEDAFSQKSEPQRRSCLLTFAASHNDAEGARQASLRGRFGWEPQTNQQQRW
eukprot:CAMPEP_0178370252 /NCGR_PEP_ID=MMETSP0689_2-20121128/205_1 /TAXON_ID=160604 /ORGANISM="Amphidinium massartii, Strain CS-259" /LENGTH=358 /DNA_ID=CAMNT_0019990065 /DNA_START=68 /DNA_END=1141 /DNA_ORIENTATION=-